VTSAVIQSHYSSHHFVGSQRSPLPPIVSGSPIPGMSKSEGKPFVHSFQPNARDFNSQNATALKRGLRRHSSSDSDPQSIRERLAKALEQLEQARAERDEFAKVAGQAQEAAKEERARAARLEERAYDMHSSIANLQQQLESQAFISKRIEREHKRSTEKLIAKFRREAEEREAKHRIELSSLKEQLEEVVLKAAVDLNRQYRDLSSEQLKAVRARRRATDGGGIPLSTELHITVRPSESKVGTPDKMSGREDLGAPSPQRNFDYSPASSDERGPSASKASTPMKREASHTWHRRSSSSGAAAETSGELAAVEQRPREPNPDKSCATRLRGKTPRN